MQADPIQQPDPLQQPAAPPQMDPKQALVKKLGPALQALIKDDVRGDVDREKTLQYAASRKHNFYYRGQQNLAPVFTGNSNTVVDWSPVAGTLRSNPQQQNSGGLYDRVFNIIRGDGRKFIAVLGQRAPNCKALPDKEDDEHAARLCRRANIESRDLAYKWDIEEIQRNLTAHLFIDGTTFGLVDFVSDEEKYGEIEEPILEMQDLPLGAGFYHCIQCGHDTPAPEMEPAMGFGCDVCGAPLGPDDLQPARSVTVPVQTGVRKYAKGDAEIRLYTVNEVTTPFYGKGIKDLPWLMLEYDEHRGRLLSIYGEGNPELKEKLSKGSQSSDGDATTSSVSQGRLTRDSISSPSGTLGPRKNRALFTRVWLRALMYELIKDEAMKKLLMENFKKGVKITAIEGEIVDLDAAIMDEDWVCCFPEVGSNMYPDAIMKDYVDVQDIVNDMHNLRTECEERKIPWFMYDPSVLSKKVMRDRAMLVAEGIPALPGSGGRLKEAIVNGPVCTTDQFTEQWVEALHERGRELIGVLPSVFGGDVGTQQTAHESEMKRNQSLMQLGTTWNEMRRFHAAARTLGIKKRAKFAMQWSNAYNDQSPDYEVSDLADLAQSGWHMECEEAMPMLWGQKRDLFWSLLDKAPAVQHFLGVDHPDNTEEIQEVFGIDGWTIPGLNARTKVFDTIQELIKGQPTQGPDGTPMPSIQVDEFEDDHNLSATIIKEWCQTDQGRASKRTNAGGYANVIAWGKQHWQMAQPPPPPPPPEKAATTLSIKGETLPPDALQAVLEKAQILPAGGPPIKQQMDQAMTPPGMPPQPGGGPSGPGAPPPGPPAGPGASAAPPQSEMTAPPPNGGPPPAPPALVH